MRNLFLRVVKSAQIIRVQPTSFLIQMAMVQLKQFLMRRNLGLGTLTPTQKLDVAGDLFLSGELIAGGNVVLSNGNLQDGLVAWWSMDGFSASTNVSDHSGRGHTGVVVNGGGLIDGKFGKSFNSDYVDDYISITDHDDFDIVQNFTISAWINMNANSVNYEYILSKNNDSFLLAVNNGKLSFSIDESAASWLQGTTDVDDGNWHHVLVLRNGTSRSVYVNGVLENTGSATGNNGVGFASIDIGRRSSSSEFFNGYIDDVRIYNRALSNKEVHALYTFNQAKLVSGGLISDSVDVSNNLSITGPLHFNTISQPNSPAAGDLYSAGGNIQFFDGSQWVSLTAGAETVWSQPGSGNLLYNSGSVTMGSVVNKQGILVVGNGGSSDNILTLDDNGSSVLTLADGGSLGIGTTTPNHKLDVSGNASFADAVVGGNVTLSDNLMPSANVIYDIGTAAKALRVVYAIDYVLLSDKNLKENIEPIHSSLARVSALRPVSYHFKTSPEQKRIGLIAQEVEEIVPEVVDTDTDTEQTKGLSYNELTSLLLAAEKERGVEIEQLYTLMEKTLDDLQAERKVLLRKLKAKRAAGGSDE